MIRLPDSGPGARNEEFKVSTQVLRVVSSDLLIGEAQGQRNNPRRYARSMGAAEAADMIRSALLGRKCKLIFRPDTDRGKGMRFSEDGGILEGKNDTESSWRITGSFLELVNSQGKVHSHFSYNPADGRFSETDDPDLGSITKHRIRGQYMIPEP